MLSTQAFHSERPKKRQDSKKKVRDLKSCIGRVSENISIDL